MTQDVAVTIQDGIQTIRMNRAAKKNALTRVMYDTMTAALKSGDADARRRRARPDGFGRRLQRRQRYRRLSAPAPGYGRAASGGASGFIGYLPLVAKPLVAAVDGLAIGVGTTLLFHCDLVYASPAASLRTPFLDLGLVPEAASSLLAPRRMGHARAFELLCLGEAFDAERALQAGLVNKIVPAGELEAQALAGRQAAGGQAAGRAGGRPQADEGRRERDPGADQARRRGVRASGWARPKPRRPSRPSWKSGRLIFRAFARQGEVVDACSTTGADA